MSFGVFFFLFMTLLRTTSAQLQVFVSDQQESLLICPQQTTAFTCMATGDLFWDAAGVSITHFAGTGTDIIRAAGGARAVIISNNGGARTSVLLFDSFPTASFTVGCNLFSSTVTISVAPQQPSSVVASYFKVSNFLYFSISFSPLGDGQTNLTYRVEIGTEIGTKIGTEIGIEIGTEVALTELFTAIAADSDNNNNLTVTVTAINACEQESPSSLPVLAVERVSTDMPSTTATTTATTERVPSTVLMEEIPTPCTKKFISTGIAVWIGISIALIVILVLCCVGLLVYIIHQKKKVILYLMKRIADLEAKQGQTMSTLSGKQPDN